MQLNDYTLQLSKNIKIDFLGQRSHKLLLFETGPLFGTLCIWERKNLDKHLLQVRARDEINVQWAAGSSNSEQTYFRHRPSSTVAIKILTKDQWTLVYDLW